MRGHEFDEAEFFGAVATSGARALLIGRRALVAIGLPVMTRDYDFWIGHDDAEAFNRALAPFELYPNKTPEEARQTGRYVLENDEKVDVLVARSVSTHDGTMIRFDDIWARRRTLELSQGVRITIPSIDDLILTKRFGARPKDAEDIRLLLVLKAKAQE
jgi:hypothetical protein